MTLSLLSVAERLASQFNEEQSRLSDCDTQMCCGVVDDGCTVQLQFASVRRCSILEPEKVYSFLAQNAPNLLTIICYSESLDKVLILAF